MSDLRIVNSHEQPIHSVGEWFQLAPPHGRERHWEDGRSAKELAKAWFRSGEARVPAELAKLFESHRETRRLVVEVGVPEWKTPLDNFRGNTRNHDLVLAGHTADGRRIFVALEAKSDEEFGPLVGRYYRDSLMRPSKAPDRIQLLCQALFGRPLNRKLRGLRYQLFHALGATLIEARSAQATLAVFVVYEFQSKKVVRANLARNEADLNRFVRVLTGKWWLSVKPGALLGPFRVPGGEFVPGDMPFLIGKVTARP